LVQVAGDCAELGPVGVPVEPPPTVGFDPPGPLGVMPLEGAPVPLPVPEPPIPAPGLAVPPTPPPALPALPAPPPAPPLLPPPLWANTLGRVRLANAAKAIAVANALLMMIPPDVVESTSQPKHVLPRATGADLRITTVAAILLTCLDVIEAHAPGSIAHLAFPVMALRNFRA